jgi:hypothetical protein
VAPAVAHNTQLVERQLLGREMLAAEAVLELLTALQIGGLVVAAELAVQVAMALAVDMVELVEQAQFGFLHLRQPLQLH